MRQLNETFENEEFDFLKSVKGNKTWRQFILDLVGYPFKGKKVSFKIKDEKG